MPYESSLLIQSAEYIHLNAGIKLYAAVLEHFTLKFDMNPISTRFQVNSNPR